jgi:hypothetical protein
MFLIILIILIVLLFGGGVGYPDGRNILWILGVVLLIWLLVSVGQDVKGTAMTKSRGT